jgi:hypothetical protein
MRTVRTVVLVAVVLLALGCKKKEGDPRLVGTWDLVIDPEYPPSYGFATITSGELVFAKDATAVRTLVLEGETASGPKTVTDVSRLEEWGIVEEDGTLWLTYRSADSKRSEGRVRINELTQGRFSVFDWGDSRTTFEFQRRM